MGGGSATTACPISRSARLPRLAGGSATDFTTFRPAAAPPAPPGMTTFMDCSGLAELVPTMCYGEHAAMNRQRAPIAGQSWPRPPPPPPPALSVWPLGCRTGALCPPLQSVLPCIPSLPLCTLHPRCTHCRRCNAGGEEELRAKMAGQPPPQTAYRPRLGNIAPRVPDWEPRRSNTQMPPLTGPVRGSLCMHHVYARAMQGAAELLNMLPPRSCRVHRTRTRGRCSSSHGRPYSWSLAQGSPDALGMAVARAHAIRQLNCRRDCEPLFRGARCSCRNEHATVQSVPVYFE